MKKVQVKILDIDKDAISAKLEELGAQKIFSEPVISSFFDNSTDDLSRAEKDVCLRECDGKYLLSFVEKLTQEGIPVCREHKLFVEKDESIHHILAGLGFSETSKNEKMRTTYVIDGMRIHLEKLGDMPDYMEVSTIEEASKVIEWVKKLGYQESDMKNWTGRDVWMHYSRD